MVSTALRSLLPIAGWSEERAGQLAIEGPSGPLARTPFRVTETAVAALGAVGLAAADLWELRTGRTQDVTLDTAHTTASLRSTHYLRLNGERIDTDEDTIRGIYAARAGRFGYLHCNFPHHRRAALDVLGVPADRAAVRDAVSGWDAAALEEAIIAAGGAGAMVRTAAEWADHPQAHAVAALPLMEIVKIGECDPQPLPPGDRPLAGMRVLDLTRVLAGPTCARTLAEQGADVMKISAPHLPRIDYQEYDTGHGKLAVNLDLREPSGLDTLRALLREADVFSQGYRPGTLAARGLSPEALAALRPGIVCVSLSAFGHTGPWSARRGFDTVVQAVSGIAVRQGEVFPRQDRAPTFYPLAAIDYLSGWLMAFGTLVALARRAREGGSWLVRVSLAQTGKWLVDHGEVPAAALRGVPAEFDAADIARWSIETETPMGRMRHLAPALQMSETPARWARPAVPLGHHRPRWPERAGAARL